MMKIYLVATMNENPARSLLGVFVIEKNGEDGYTMYQYSDGEDTQSWYNTYYTSDNMDDTYLNTPALDDEADYAETLDDRCL